MSVTIKLTRQQADKLDEVLSMAQDEGPTGYGWASKELSELKKTVGLQVNSTSWLADYLCKHESDIANSINDFGDLRFSFIVEFGREPKDK